MGTELITINYSRIEVFSSILYITQTLCWAICTNAVRFKIWPSHFLQDEVCPCRESKSLKEKPKQIKITSEIGEFNDQV